MDNFVGWTYGDHAASLQEECARSEGLDEGQVVGAKEERASTAKVGMDGVQEARLEPDIAAAKRLIHEEKIWLFLSHEGVAESKSHPQAVGSDGAVEGIANSSELSDDIHSVVGGFARNAAHHQTIEGILASGLDGIEAGVRIQQLDVGGAGFDRASGGAEDPGGEVHEGALAGSVEPDDAEHLASMDGEMDILKGPEFAGAEGGRGVWRPPIRPDVRDGIAQGETGVAAEAFPDPFEGQ